MPPGDEAAAGRDRHRPAFSLIVPCYREELALPLLFQEVLPALDRATGGDFEIILVDDGSPDATYAIIVAQHQLDPRVKGLQLSRNFGHQPALACGLAFAQGNVIGIIDADLQDPVDVLIRLYEAVHDGTCDVCYGVRRKRDAPFHLKFFYWLFYLGINLFSDHPWPRNAGDFSAFNRRVLDCLVAMPENLRMIRGLRAWVGFRQSSIPYDRPRRRAGVSSYHLISLTRLALSAFIGFTHLPLQLANYVGLTMSVVTMGMGALLLGKLFAPKAWTGMLSLDPGLTVVLLCFSLVASMMFLCLGIMGEYISVILWEVKRRPTAIVRQSVGEVERLASADYIQLPGPAAAMSDSPVRRGT
jgi:dolichol-phosphate mannosyltransferase